jgi:hypothetical protein
VTRWHRRLFGVAFLLVCYGLVGLALGAFDPVVALNLTVLGVLGCVYFYLRARSARPPTPPRSVRIWFPDGRVVPVECVYSGTEDGTHIWTMVVPSAIRQEDLFSMALSISVDALPARTAVRFPVEP